MKFGSSGEYVIIEANKTFLGDPNKETNKDIKWRKHINNEIKDTNNKQWRDRKYCIKSWRNTI